MKQSVPRIGKVVLKGGATVHRLPTQRYEDCRGRLVDDARTIAGFFGPEQMVGFMVMGWCKDGHMSVGFHLAEKVSFNRSLLPALAADAIRRELIEGGYWPLGA